MNYGNKSNNRRIYQPKTSITNQIITDEEKLAAETALRSLKQKMANKEKKPIRQTNTANQGRRMQNYNNVNMKGNNYIHMSHTPNYNNNNMKYNYPTNATEINKNKGYYQNNMKQNMNNKKPITANEYRNNHNYNANNNQELNNNDIYMNQNNYQKRGYNQNEYNINNRDNKYKNDNNVNNYYQNYSNNINSNYSNNYKMGKPQRLNNASANVNKKNLNLNNYNNYNYNPKMSTQDNENDDPRPIGGGLTADQIQGNNQNMINNNKFEGNNILVNNKNKGINKLNNNIENNGYENISKGMNYATAFGYKHCEFCDRNYNEEAYNKHLNFCKRRYENEKLKSKQKKSNSNNSGVKNQFSKGIYGNVKYNNNVKYSKKK